MELFSIYLPTYLPTYLHTYIHYTSYIHILYINHIYIHTYLLCDWLHSELLSVGKHWLRSACHHVSLCGLRLKVELEAAVQVLCRQDSKSIERMVMEEVSKW